GGAWAAAVLAADYRFAVIVQEHRCWLPQVAPYEPGRFFVRELPAIRAVLTETGQLDAVLVDGYVDLDPAGRPGLGAYLHSEIRVPVVGVAKTPFRSATHAVPVRRGNATRPLYITAAGVPLDRAAALVAAMAGAHRIPDALRRLDALTRAHG